MPLPRYPRVGDIDPSRDAADIVRAYIDSQAARLGCLMPAIGRALEGVKVDVTETQLYEDVQATAQASTGYPWIETPADLERGRAIVARVRAALETTDLLHVDAEQIPVHRAGFILRVAETRLALAADEGVSSADVGTIACLSSSRVRQIAIAERWDREPGGRNHYGAGAVRRFLALREVPGF
jgi:hypothetical protein